MVVVEPGSGRRPPRGRGGALAPIPPANAIFPQPADGVSQAQTVPSVFLKRKLSLRSSSLRSSVLLGRTIACLVKRGGFALCCCRRARPADPTVLEEILRGFVLHLSARFGFLILDPGCSPAPPWCVRQVTKSLRTPASKGEPRATRRCARSSRCVRARPTFRADLLPARASAARIGSIYPNVSRSM
jgi:hypothetical protein